LKTQKIIYTFIICLLAFNLSSQVLISDSLIYKFRLKRSIPNSDLYELDDVLVKYGLTGKNKELGLFYRYYWKEASSYIRVKDPALDSLSLVAIRNYDSIELQLYKKDSMFGWDVFVTRHQLVWKKYPEDIRIFDLYQICSTSKVLLQDIHLEDSLMYFNLTCPSYSNEMGGQCSRLYCMNVNTRKLSWSSEPITSSGIFIVQGDLIVCGYGFTDELDYVYLIDKKSGRRLASYKLNKMMEYVEIKGEELYVIDYNRRVYVFEIQKIKK
jgi:hypothetical protein